jgi:hypothetical protein
LSFESTEESVNEALSEISHQIKAVRLLKFEDSGRCKG